MQKQSGKHYNPWEGFHGPNLGYVLELYDQYLEDPHSIEDEVAELFKTWGPPPTFSKEEKYAEVTPISQSSSVNIEKILLAAQLADRIRTYGHLGAKINPIHEKQTHELLEISTYGLTEDDLVGMPASIICPEAPPSVRNGLDAINHLKKVYCQTIAYEFHHVTHLEEKQWLRNHVEAEYTDSIMTPEHKKNVLRRLTEVEGFEKFLHKTYVGQKRFSIEGLDSMVPLLDEIVSESVQNGTQNVNIGMAHRGRLNVLAHVLCKPYELIFSEFQHAPNKDLVPSEGSVGINYGWSGDVKYHLGLDRQIKKENTIQARITLANNPSHLEFVGSVVEGFTRASQDDRDENGYGKHTPDRALAILIHGDAAFPGQGIVAETLNLSRLTGYNTGGTIHVIANNMIGFTTDTTDSRSTLYASDLAKGFEVPIIHVNADDPEAVLKAARFAHYYRKTFKKDFIIDLIGYRRFGHNEMDEPMATNPKMYTIIHQHLTTKELYAERLIKEGILTKEEANSIEEEVNNILKEAHEKVPATKKEVPDDIKPPETVEKGIPQLQTNVPKDVLLEVNRQLLTWPESFQPLPKLARILQRREDAVQEGGKVDWAHAEALSFGSILKDGTPIRLSGQDSERGTFAHRHLVLHDHQTGEKYCSLQHVSEKRASFAIYNSPLSEGSVLGFEYGYNVFAPETLVLWEAQYGDFANAAQVIFDQFIAAGRAKWGQKSGLVILLPHGYEGQGPEHSSARVERFLTLAAENNWTVANLTKASQYFHILRRQAAILQKEEVRPLVLMTPKSLLRHPKVSVSIDDLANGEFNSILENEVTGTQPQKVERLVLSTGKVSIDLSEALEHQKETDWLHLSTIEEIYPFPMEQLKGIISRFPNLKEIVWVQEEPKNMGAWNFIEPRLVTAANNTITVDYIGRKRRSSPAEGDPNIHKKEQARIIHESLTRSKGDQ